MTTTRRLGLLLVLLSSGIFIVWGATLERTAPGAMVDFKAVYYGSRCLLQHTDPYSESEFLRVYQAEAGNPPSDSTVSRVFRRGVLFCVNLPATLLLVVPLAMLPWAIAHVLWMTLTAAALMLAAFLLWNTGMSRAQGVPLLLICLVLANTEVLLAVGNAAGIVVGLSVVAAWCFLRGRFAAAGVLCLALGFAIKPQDAGPVWLCFLLLGGIYRRRAWQTLAVTALLSLASVLWVAHISPHWMAELHSNLAVTSERGDINDPGPTSLTGRTADPIIDLQSVVSALRDDSRFYNPATFLICVPLILAWAFVAFRSSPSPENAWVGLAAIVALSLVVTYHRLYDAKLLLLTIPACAMLWEEGGPVGWLALLLNAVGILLTGDIPSMLLRSLTAEVQISGGGLCERMMAALATRPIPIVLLILSMFYLWVFVHRAAPLFAEGLEERPRRSIHPRLPAVPDRKRD